MPHLLQRLYRTKLSLLATIFTSTGIILLGVAQWGDWGWLDSLPASDIGSALFTTGLIAIVFEYFDSKDADERARHRIRDVFDDQVSVLRDAVIDGFAMQPERLAAVASPETLDRVIRNSLAARVGDADLARDIYANLAQQITHDADRRRYDAQVTITLTPAMQGPRTGLGSMFVVTTRWQYRASSLPALLRFSAVSDHEVYRRLVRDPASIETWFFDPTSTGAAADPSSYQLLQCTINGRPQPIEHRAGDSGHLFTVTTDQAADDASGGVDVSYTHQTLVTQHGHLLFIDFATTKGLRVNLTYTPDCGIRHVSVLDYISSTTKPRIERSPASVVNPTINIEYDDSWTFPRSGAAFVWVLDREVASQEASIVMRQGVGRV
jgi:hypothetical protein